MLFCVSLLTLNELANKAEGMGTRFTTTPPLSTILLEGLIRHCHQTNYDFKDEKKYYLNASVIGYVLLFGT